MQCRHKHKEAGSGEKLNANSQNDVRMQILHSPRSSGLLLCSSSLCKSRMKAGIIECDCLEA